MKLMELSNGTMYCVMEIGYEIVPEAEEVSFESGVDEAET